MDVPHRATPREWLGLAVLCLPTMLAALDINVMFLALPHVSADLGATGVEQLWITDIYGFMIAGFLITMGNLGDRIGRRRILLVGAAGFIAASLLAAASTSTETLIVARALLGIFGAAVTPSVLALIRTMFTDPKQMTVAMGIWGTSLMAGMVLGPVVGGLLLGGFWWGSIFLIALPIMGLLLILGPILVPESRNPDAGPIDPISVAYSLLAILPLVYGLKELAREGREVPPILGVVSGLLFLLLFVRRQRRLSTPLLDLAMFRSRPFATAALLALAAPLIAGGTNLMTTMFLQMVKGYSPLRIALWLIIPAVAMIVVGNAAAGAARKIKPAYVLAAASGAASVGMVVISQVEPASSMGLIIGGLVISFVGGGTVGILSAILIMVSAPPERAGAAGSVSAALGEFGTALGVALLGVVGTAVYRHEVVVPAGAAAGTANEAESSIAGAISAAPALPADMAAALLQSAREAFTSGLSTVSIVAAFLFLGLAAFALVGLRDVPASESLTPMAAAGGPPAAPEVARTDEIAH